jgi:hypothetical protein
VKKEVPSIVEDNPGEEDDMDEDEREIWEVRQVNDEETEKDLSVHDEEE